MRREALVIVLAGLAGVQPAAAQGFGWLFGEPPPHRRASSRRARAAPLAVPMPVARPRGLDDAATPPEAARTADVARSELGTASDAPLPPERPPQSELSPASPLPPDEPRPIAVEAARPDVPKPGISGPTIQKPEAARPDAVKPEAAPPDGKAADTHPVSAEPAVVPLPPAKPANLAPAHAVVAPSGATTAYDPREPAPDAGCADRLKARGVIAEVTTLGPQSDARCTVVQPMHLVSATLIDGTIVTFPDKPTIACVTADAFSAYVHDLLGPLAKGTYGIGLASVWTGPGLECRSRDHIFGAKLSAHGQGLAVDIAQLQLDDGRRVAVGEPKTDAEQHFETAARAGGCGYFHTVLGPGSDSYHRTHWHFDLEVRGKDGDSKYCK